MGEAKRRRDRMTPADKAALDLTHELVRRGELIFGGFAAYCRLRKVDVDAPHMPALHDAFMAGAEHLWSSIMATLDPGVEPTAADEARMDAIGREVEAWRAKQASAFARVFPTKGSA